MYERVGTVTHSDGETIIDVYNIYSKKILGKKKIATLYISGYGYGSTGGSGGSGNGNNSGVPASLARRPAGWTLGGVLGLTNGADNIQAANGYIQSAAQ